MKILVVCQYYYPENFQITPICEQLVVDGYDVTVLTGLPNYPTGTIPEEYKEGHRREIINGVKVIRVYERGRTKGVVGLSINYGSFVLFALNKIKRLHKDYDVVFCYQLSPVTMAIPAMKFSKKNRIPFMLYCCDLWPESMKMYVSSENNPVFKAVKKLSRKIYASADKIVAQSMSFVTYLAKTHGIPDDRMVYIPAFADEAYLMQDFIPEDEVTDFVFLGNLGIAQNLTAVLEAIEKIKDVPGFKVHFVGDGTVLNKMKRYVADHGLEKTVYFYGRKPVEEMSEYYKLADACLVSLKADNATGLTLPSKVQGYMAAGKPVIGMIDGSAKDVIDESGCGICVNAGDIDGLADGMRDFIQNREKYAECGRKGRQYFIDNFSKDKFMKKLECEIERSGRK